MACIQNYAIIYGYIIPQEGIFQQKNQILFGRYGWSGIGKQVEEV